MAIQIVMDRNGDTCRHFDINDAQSVALAKQRFDELTKRGYRAVALAPNGGEGALLEAFDAKAERTLFIPALKGG